MRTGERRTFLLPIPTRPDAHTNTNANHFFLPPLSPVPSPHAVWAAFINTVSATGISDLVLTLISLGAFVLGLVLGALNFGRWAGMLLVGFLGGLSVGVRVVLLRPGLLVPNYVVNWLVLVPFMLVGIFVVLVRQRVGIVSVRSSFCSSG